MNTPKISIIVPCYNQSQYLDEALESILEQTFKNWECIIVNDGSPDNTEETAKNWIEKDNRFIYLYKENGGLSSARNEGITIAQGEYILPLDADDKIASTYLKLAIEAFETDSSLKLVYCKAEKFGYKTGVWNLPIFTLENLAKNNMIFCTALFRKKEWELVQGYDEKMIYGWEDWEFWISILKSGGKVKCLDETGFYYRTKPSSMLTEVQQKQGNYLLDYLSVKHADFFVKYYGSFKVMEHQLIALEKKNEENLKSEKFVIDLFCATFFGFSIFGKYKKKKG
jgi:glycosyltransferase involved in cell wall biosynthesis